MNDDISEIFNKFTDILKDKNINLNDITGGNTIPPADTSDFSLKSLFLMFISLFNILSSLLFIPLTINVFL